MAKKHGVELFYRRNQTVWKSIEWRWGKKHGNATEYYYSGEVKSIQLWNRNRKKGFKKFYDLDGSKINWFVQMWRMLVKTFTF